ncbi:MAG: hypothetical protein GXY03_02490 [Solirubrobacterales bacterium]|nr:hypothetical protein [Solirubrobacterales bacterium]
MTWEVPPADVLLGRWVGRTVTTVTGAPNRILKLDGDNVVVATRKSPAGEGVALADVQGALDELERTGTVTVDRSILGYRSAFCGAVIRTLAGTRRVPGSPPRLQRREVWEPSVAEDGDRSLNAWWEHIPAERYWMEITDREDIGTDLHSPQRDATGKPNPGYSALLYLQDGDIVFHYDRNEQAIIAWSRAVGPPGAAPTFWASHRGATRRRLGTQPREQPGWWLDLEGPFLLTPPVTLAALRATGNEILAILDDLAGAHGSIYAPFYGYGTNRELRPTQYYLNKVPAALVALLTDQPLPPARPTPIGEQWRQPIANNHATGQRQVQVDIETVERGLRGHIDTETALATALRAHGLEPLSPGPTDPNFDIAWRTADTLYVAEIKSLTAANEERQLRLGLGQVLRYRTQLEANTELPVRALLIPERAPTDPTWTQVCAAVGVDLVPGTALLERPGRIGEIPST